MSSILLHRVRFKQQHVPLLQDGIHDGLSASAALEQQVRDHARVRVKF